MAEAEGVEVREEDAVEEAEGEAVEVREADADLVEEAEAVGEAEEEAVVEGEPVKVDIAVVEPLPLAVVEADEEAVEDVEAVAEGEAEEVIVSRDEAEALGEEEGEGEGEPEPEGVFVVPSATQLSLVSRTAAKLKLHPTPLSQAASQRTATKYQDGALPSPCLYFASYVAPQVPPEYRKKGHVAEEPSITSVSLAVPASAVKTPLALTAVASVKTP